MATRSFVERNTYSYPGTRRGELTGCTRTGEFRRVLWYQYLLLEGKFLPGVVGQYIGRGLAVWDVQPSSMLGAAVPETALAPVPIARSKLRTRLRGDRGDRGERVGDTVILLYALCTFVHVLHAHVYDYFAS